MGEGDHAPEGVTVGPDMTGDYYGLNFADNRQDFRDGLRLLLES
jgi:hypothetical protein